MQSKEQVLAKVRKCLALGNNEGATEAERERALAQAGKLLASINLTMSQIADVIEDRIHDGMDIPEAQREWTRAAASGIAKLFFCTYYRHMDYGAKGAKFFFVGKSVNVNTAQMMLQYVIDNIVKEAKKRLSMAKLASFGDISAPSGAKADKDWQYAFCLGASEAVRKKCSELIAERERDGVQSEEGSGTALVVMDLAKSEHQRNMDLLKALGVHLTTTSIKSARDGAGYGAGREHGSSINLSRQVGSSSGRPLMIGKK